MFTVIFDLLNISLLNTSILFFKKAFLIFPQRKPLSFKSIRLVKANQIRACYSSRKPSTFAFQWCAIYRDEQWTEQWTVVCGCAVCGWDYLCFGKLSCFQSCPAVIHLYIFWAAIVSTRCTDFCLSQLISSNMPAMPTMVWVQGRSLRDSECLQSMNTWLINWLSCLIN